MSVVEQKKSIRQQMRQRRQTLTPLQLHDAAQGLLRQAADFFTDADYPIALYLSFDGEIDTKPLITSAWQRGRPIFLPVVQEKGTPLLFREYDSATILQRNCYGIGEPASGATKTADSMRTIGIPLTAFDRQGGRVGMGGGYYDVTLSALKTSCNLVGFAYEFQELESCPREPHDQCLDWIVTPSETIKIESR